MTQQGGARVRGGGAGGQCVCWAVASYCFLMAQRGTTPPAVLIGTVLECFGCGLAPEKYCACTLVNELAAMPNMPATVYDSSFFVSFQDQVMVLVDLVVLT